MRSIPAPDNTWGFPARIRDTVDQKYLLQLRVIDQIRPPTSRWIFNDCCRNKCWYICGGKSCWSRRRTTPNDNNRISCDENFPHTIFSSLFSHPILITYPFFVFTPLKS